MGERPAILVIACGALAHEIVALRHANDWPHLVVQCLPADLHNRPEKIPAAVRDKVNADMRKVIADPEIKTRFDTFAFEPISWSPEEIARAAEAKSRLYEGLVKKANISLE